MRFPSLILFTLTLSATGGFANAQEAYLYAFRDEGRISLSTLEVDGGALLANDTIDITGQVSASLDVPLCIEYVGNEIWIGGAMGIERLTWPALTNAGRIQTGTPVTAIVPSTTGATAFSSDSAADAIEYDLAGTELSRTPLGDIGDIAPAPNGWFAIRQGGPPSIIALDPSFQDLGEVGLAFVGLASAQGSFFSPERINRLSNGQYGIAAGASVGVMDPSGVGLEVFNPGGFERDVLETTTGELVVPAVVESSLVDLASGAFIQYMGPMFAPQRTVYSSSTRNIGTSPSLQRTCTTSPNSAGARGGRLLAIGIDQPAVLQPLTIGATGLPADSFSLLIYGQTAFTGPFGGGTLCISPFAPGIIRSEVRQVSSFGAVETELTYSGPGLGIEFTAGSTWIFQVIYRDAIGGVATFNATDSVEITFAN